MAHAHHLKTLLAEAAQEHKQAKADQDHWTDYSIARKKDLSEIQTKLAAENKALSTMIAGASEIGERVVSQRKCSSLEKEYNSAKAALEQREKRQHASVEEIEIEFRSAHDALKQAQTQIEEMNTFIGQLKVSMVKRMNQFLRFRRSITQRSKLQFAYHLAQRGFSGNLLFNHKERKLDLKINTEARDSSNQNKELEKDAKSLSGGEKSFSTICLLLALWEAVGAPVRALDEFDVFQDAVNRRISIQMVLLYARSNPSVQHILITPQDMSNVTLGDDVNVFRMEFVSFVFVVSYKH